MSPPQGELLFEPLPIVMEDGDFPLLDDRSCSEFEDELDALFLVGLLGGGEEEGGGFMVEEEKPTKRARVLNEDAEQRRFEIKARNRASAERTRQRRLDQMKVLEERKLELDEENTKLEMLLTKSFGVGNVENAANVNMPVMMEPMTGKRQRRSRAKKGDVEEAVKKLSGCEKLPPQEIARLRKEARMARNRASAERTRQRRLAATQLLQADVARLEMVQGKLLELLSASLDNCQDEAMRKMALLLLEKHKQQTAANACENFEVFSDRLKNETGPVTGESVFDL